MADTGFHGMHGRILSIDLTSKEYATEDLGSQTIEQVLGGRGLGAALLYRELPEGADPLGADNVMIFTTGPLTDTRAPGSNRYCLVTKSPLTGQYLYSIAGGHFGAELKRTGVDGVIIKGRASSPTYLIITESKVEFRDASSYWGLTTGQTQEFIKSDLKDEKVRIACIGPAGEHQVLYACIQNERRSLGRGGPGAVMGSKNLKAIAVRGRTRIPSVRPEALSAAAKKYYQEVNENPVAKAFTTLGSATVSNLMSTLGIMPARNWQEGTPPEFKQISPNTLRAGYLVKDAVCAAGCPVRCSKFYKVKSGKYAGRVGEGPEYESLYSLGTCCGIYDPQTVIAADDFCDQYGLDTISAGVSIAFAIECFEKGSITKSDTNGMELRFGDGNQFMRLLRESAYKQGFGEILALGSRRMAERFGNESADFAMQVKGMELGGYDPRGAKGMGLTYACGPRGGCHHAGGYSVIDEISTREYDRHSIEGKAELVRRLRNIRSSVCDSGLICGFVFALGKPETAAELIAAATGLDYSIDDLIIVGDRIATLERIINVSEGLTPEQDTLPKRLLSEAMSEGPNKGQTVDIESMKREFYGACGWDEVTGLPTPERIAELQMEEILSAGKRVER